MSREQTNGSDLNQVLEPELKILETILSQPAVLEVNQASWADWRASLSEHITYLADGYVLGVVGPDLNREMPKPPRIKKFLAKFHLATAIERPSRPWVGLFRSRGSMHVLCPDRSQIGGEFPWTDAEYETLLTQGWRLPHKYEDQTLKFATWFLVPSSEPEFKKHNPDDDAKNLQEATEMVSSVFEHVVQVEPSDDMSAQRPNNRPVL